MKKVLIYRFVWDRVEWEREVFGICNCGKVLPGILLTVGIYRVPVARIPITIDILIL